MGGRKASKEGQVSNNRLYGREKGVKGRAGAGPKVSKVKKRPRTVHHAQAGFSGTKDACDGCEPSNMRARNLNRLSEGRLGGAGGGQGGRV